MEKYINKLLQDIFGALFFAAVFAYLSITRGVIEAVILTSSYIVHELFHVFAAIFLGVKVVKTEIGFFGLQMRYARDDLKPGASAFIFIAGPLGNILLALLVNVAAQFAYIPKAEFIVFYNIVLALINLLPSYPLDCARALEALARLRLPLLESVSLVVMASQMTALLVFALGLYIFVYRTDNFLLMAFAIFLFISTAKEASSSRLKALVDIVSKGTFKKTE